MQAPISPSSKRRSRPERSVAGHLLNGLLWWVLPGFVVAVVVAYILGAVIGHVNPPVVPVQGLSMRPTLQGGDLVFLENVNPKLLRKGDIIAVTVPPDVQKQYALPSHIVHRIVKINHNPSTGLSFVTKGDANAGSDVFTTQPNDVVGKLRFVIPGAGYPFLFLRSRQGEIFLGAAALLLLLYFGLGLMEDRRVVVEGTAATMQNVLAETQELRLAVEAAKQGSADNAGVAMWPGTKGRQGMNGLVDEVRLTRERSDETRETVRELVSAIGEYGVHLRSHTAVMQNLAAVTGELHRATASFQSARAELPREGEEQNAPAAKAIAVKQIMAAASDRVVLDPFSFLPPELLAQRDSLMSTAARVDRLLYELSARLGLANDC